MIKKYKNTYNEIKNMFINFFIKNNHELYDSSSIIPNNDLKILFTNSGMNQFLDFFLCKKKSEHKNIITAQKCIRLGGKFNDLNNIGNTNIHNTSFEMLGNFSFGGYYKDEALYLSLLLLTDKNLFNISKKKLIVTIHYLDNVSYNILIKLGIKKDKIFKIGNKNRIIKSNNFWYIDNNYPCGMSVEFFFCNNENILLNKNNINIYCIEIWNLVFIENILINNKLNFLPLKSVDTGMGIERLLSILQNVKSNYEIDLFEKIIFFLTKFLNVDKNNLSLKIIFDHLKTIILIINENIVPNKKKRGYVLRKIIRRAIIYGILININKPFLYKISENIVYFSDFFNNEIINNINYIKNIILEEETKFFILLNKNYIILYKEINKLSNKIINENVIFYLYDTLGMPLILLNNILKKKGIYYNKKKFKNLIIKQKKS